jgi:hypothetical protein
VFQWGGALWCAKDNSAQSATLKPPHQRASRANF